MIISYFLVGDGLEPINSFSCHLSLPYPSSKVVRGGHIIQNVVRDSQIMKMITISQAVKMTGRSRVTLARWCRKGIVPGAKKDRWGYWEIPEDVIPQLRKPKLGRPYSNGRR